MIKKLLAFSAVCLMLSTAEAQNLRTPAPSPTQTIKQDFGLGSIELNYSRPSLKGRKIGTDLAPYGQVWRTGANAATTLTFSDEVTIGGTKIPAGKYGLVSIPEKDNWTFIVTRQLNITSPGAYKKENDVVRVQVKPAKLSQPVETMAIQFANITPTTTDLQVQWGEYSLSVPIKTEIDAKIMGQIDNLMNKDNRPYYTAGLYYLEGGKDVNKAVEWLGKAAEQTPDYFWVQHNYAKALAKAGRKEDARKAANRSIELAKKDGNDEYVKFNEDLLSSLK
jgi:hypothetical protein